LGRYNGAPRDYAVPLSSLPRDATHVAVIIQTLGQGSITGAASLAIAQ
jgi:hypothetical protein